MNSHPSREGQVWGSLIDPLERADTLERNPICVDPNQVQAQIVKSEHYQVVQTQSQQMQWEDPTSTITFGPEDLLLLQQNGTPTVNNYGPTSANPCIDDFKGDCSFGIAFEAMTASNKSKHWDVSVFSSLSHTKISMKCTYFILVFRFAQKTVCGYEQIYTWDFQYRVKSSGGPDHSRIANLCRGWIFYLASKTLSQSRTSR